MSEAIAEVIESSTRSITAEVYRQADPPAFGSWVQASSGDGTVLMALVSHVEIAGFEPNRRAVAFGKTTDELRREMPQVLELLRTTFRAQVVAFRNTDGKVCQTLPPYPASMHGFVEVCTRDHVRALGAPYDFLRTLALNPDPAVPVDELLVVVLRQIYDAHGKGSEGQKALIEAARILSRLLRDDHERLQSILRRVA